jgi:hypothetical protein
MAEGHSLPALEFGGGFEFDVSSRGFVRIDIGSRWLRYPGPAIDADREVRDSNFWGARSRLSFGGGVKF